MLTPRDFLAELRRRGATRLSRVTFRENRSVFWSLTQQATVLNLHTAYRAAPPELLDAFAALVRARGARSSVTGRAVSEINNWPEVRHAIETARASFSRPDTACCATPAQRSYLRVLYRYFNATRFDGELPDDVPVRLSSRMRTSLGHMLPGSDALDGTRRVEEIALNVDLMLEENGAERIDTLLHEMAHVGDYLESGQYGHGPTWRAWARRAGCRPTRLYDRPVASRRQRRDRVGRVPPLPDALSLLAT